MSTNHKTSKLCYFALQTESGMANEIEGNVFDLNPISWVYTFRDYGVTKPGNNLSILE